MGGVGNGNWHKELQKCYKLFPSYCVNWRLLSAGLFLLAYRLDSSQTESQRRSWSQRLQCVVSLKSNSLCAECIRCINRKMCVMCGKKEATKLLQLRSINCTWVGKDRPYSSSPSRYPYYPCACASLPQVRCIINFDSPFLPDKVNISAPQLTTKLTHTHPAHTHTHSPAALTRASWATARTTCAAGQSAVC